MKPSKPIPPGSAKVVHDFAKWLESEYGALCAHAASDLTEMMSKTICDAYQLSKRLQAEGAAN